MIECFDYGNDIFSYDCFFLDRWFGVVVVDVGYYGGDMLVFVIE